MKTQSPPKLELDPDEYRHYLKDVKVSDEQAEQLLEGLWHIMRTFVDIGWGLETIQKLLPELAESSSPDSANPIKQKRHLTLVHNRVACKKEE